MHLFISIQPNGIDLINLDLINLHHSISQYSFVKPVTSTGATNNFIFFPADEYYYTLDNTNIPIDIPGKIEGLFVAVNKENKIIKIALYIADKENKLQSYLINKLGSSYSIMQAGGIQVGYRNHYIWNIPIKSQVYFLPQAYNPPLPLQILSVIEVSYFRDFDLLTHYSTYVRETIQ